MQNLKIENKILLNENKKEIKKIWLENFLDDNENTVDLFTEEYNEKAKIAKDVAAGAVLISAINAICMGLIIYLDKIVQILF